METVTSPERNAAEENLHVFQRRDRRAALADLALAHRVIGVVAHQGGQVEGDRETGLPLRQQVVVAAVGLLRRGEAGELAHGPELAAVHVAMDAARVGELARFADLARGIDLAQIVRAVHRLNRHPTNCRKLAFGGFHESPTIRYSNPCATADTTVMWLLARYIENETITMFKSTIFREYDIRGIADVELLDADVEQLGRAFGTYLQRHAGQARSTWAAIRASARRACAMR